MIYLTENSADCNARLIIGGRRASVVAKTFNRIGFVPGQKMHRKAVHFVYSGEFRKFYLLSR